MIRFAISLIAVSALFSGCFRLGIKGDGILKTEERSVSAFSKVVIAGGYEVQWTPGKPALNITTDQNLLGHIRTTVTGNTLKIESDDDLRPTRNTVVIISSDSLGGVQATGAITFRANQINGEDLKLESTGASTISVGGAVSTLDVNLTGASTLNAHSLETKTASLMLTGASSADVTVSDTLKVSVTGAGSVRYAGNPKAVDKTVTGAGSVVHRQ